MEFYYLEEPLIHVRSASRLGKSVFVLTVSGLSVLGRILHKSLNAAAGEVFLQRLLKMNLL